MNHSDFLDCLEARRRLPTATEVPILTGLMGVGTPRQNTAGRYAVAHGIGGRPVIDFYRRHSSKAGELAFFLSSICSTD